MRTWRKTSLLSAALSAALSVWVLAGCSTSNSPCGPTNCPGCCDVAGVCQPGSEALACGSSGGQCAECSATEHCSGACLPLGGDGGNPDSGSGSDGGLACHAGNCSGCCQGEVCIPFGSQSPNVCGSAGVTCGVCPGNGGCDGGHCSVACGPTNCASGCCDTAGFCQSGDTLGACGMGGQACLACSAGYACQGGFCRGLDGGCDPNTCPGCCAGVGSLAACVSGTSNLACGHGGGACDICNLLQGESCQQGTCTRTDGGLPTWDGGMPTWDGGFPRWDGGFPRWDGGFPTWDGGFPTWDGGFPTWDGGFPWGDGGFPWGDGGFSWDAGGCGPGTADPCLTGCCLYGFCVSGTSRFMCGTGGETCQQCQNNCVQHVCQ